jgi:hypothetical protein
MNPVTTVICVQISTMTVKSTAAISASNRQDLPAAPESVMLLARMTLMFPSGDKVNRNI